MECSFQLCDMKEELENLVKSLIKSQCLYEAIDLVSMTLGQIPHYSVLQSVIYKVLMKTPNKSVAITAIKYLTNILEMYPPKDSDTRSYYYNVLSYRTVGKLDLWDVVADTIRTCLYVCEVDSKPPKIYQDYDLYQGMICNSRLLLQYFIKVLQADFENFSTERYARTCRNQCLLAKFFWPNGESISMKRKCEQLLIWINDVYKHKINHQKMDTLKKLQELFCLLAKYHIFCEGLSEVEGVHCQQLNEIARTVCRFCCNIFETYEKLRIFLLGIDIRWLRIKICENLIHKSVYQCWLPSNTAFLTLRKIVRQYMFPPLCNKDIYKSAGECFQPTPLKISEERNHRGETQLHIACASDKPGTLLELIRNGGDINCKDNYGWTPLHKACHHQSVTCAYLLCCGLANSERVEYEATNNDGLTPLHCAVIVDSVEIADMLIQNGGLCILDIKDNEGKIPGDHVRSHEMKELFKNYEVSQIISITNAENIHNVDVGGLTRKPPSLRDFKAYRTYLLFLNFLLIDYIEIFQLKNITIREKSNMEETMTKHLIEHCDYVYEPTIQSVVPLLDDLIWMPQMSSIIQEFSKALTTQTQPAKIDLSLPLMPFHIIAAAL